jgi:hypothetical protein
MPVPRSLDGYGLTPLQLAIYEIDQLDLTLRDSTRLATARMGYYVGQHLYLREQAKLTRYIEQYGPPDDEGWDPLKQPREAAPQAGSP